MDRWILAFLIGYALALFSPVLFPITLLIALFCFVIGLTLCFLIINNWFFHRQQQRHKQQQKPETLFNKPLVLTVINGVTAGGVYLMVMANLHFANNFVTSQAQTFLIKGQVNSVVINKPQRLSVAFSINVKQINDMPVNQAWYLPDTYIRVNWYKPRVMLQQGDEILAKVKLAKPHGYQNAFGFDFTQWLFAKQFVATGNIKKLHSYKSMQQRYGVDYFKSMFFSKPFLSQPNTQQQSTNKLLNSTDGLESQNIILAVSLGNRSLITSEQFELYNHMGISHLLAISGLHIGIIFLVLRLLLKWLAAILNFYVNYGVLQILVLGMLWLYIGLINFPISATRAALFVTLWVCLNISFNNVNKIKLLLLIAFLSVLVEPFAMLTAAWWLTFSAVFGIVLFVQIYPVFKYQEQVDDESQGEHQIKDGQDKDSHQHKDGDLIEAENVKPVQKRWPLIFIARVGIFKKLNPSLVWCKALVARLRYLLLFQVFISIWMTPVVLYWFGGLSFSGVITNLIAIPLFSLLLVPCIFIGTVLVMFDIGVGVYLFLMADYVLTLLITGFSDYSLFHYWLDVANGLWLYVLFAVVLFLVFPLFYYHLSDKDVIKKSVFGSLLIVLLSPVFLSLVNWQNAYVFNGNLLNKSSYAVNKKADETIINSLTKVLLPDLTMYILDVGQGTSVVLKQGKAGFVYDLGPIYPSGFNATQSVVKPILVGFGITQLDHIIISHNDSDHIGDINVLGDKHWQASKIINCSPMQFDWLNAEVEVLWPQAARSNTLPSNIKSLSKNDGSCVIKVTDKLTKQSVLLTGDITSTIERRLVNMHKRGSINLKSELLMSAHHGSKYSSSVRFIKAVSPEAVFHSAGVNNRFGFPTQEVRNRFDNLAIEQYSTNEIGMIKVVFNRNNNHVEITGRLNHWQPFWKKQNPFRFSSEIR